MISVDLLREVLKQPDIHIITLNNKSNLGYSIGYIKTSNINIYELAHKCKEWAVSKGYNLQSSMDTYDSPSCCIIWKMHGVFPYASNYKELIKADAEPEAIFNACEWVLNETTKSD